MIEKASEMRRGPEGRDPQLQRDIQFWSLAIATDWPFGGPLTLPEGPPYTVDVKVKFATRESALGFERLVMDLLKSSF
jgi:hypothetical protein